METPLSDIEARVLGSLLEKSYATPEVYPLTLRALTAACNQRSNRDPVMEAEEAAVEEAVSEMRYKGLTWMVTQAGSRTQKFKHNIGHFGEINAVEQAILCELLLRGPQTLAELRARIVRLNVEADAETVAGAVQSLAQWGDAPLVAELPREPGRRETRVMHCLCGLPTAASTAASGGTEAVTVRPLTERVAALESDLVDQRAKIEALQAQFAQFIKQFE